MSFTKYASLESAQVLDLKGSANRIEGASLQKLADFDEFRTQDGYLYARIRAISSRVNKNHDGWPSVELAGGQDVFDRHVAGRREASITVEADSNHEFGYSTFLGKPIFVDHHNSDPSRARGVIVDAKLHVEDHKTAAEHDAYYASAPSEHVPPTWVELLLEVDAKSFPKLAKAIIEGSKNPNKGIDGFSMGCDVQHSVCNICKNSASTPHDYCKHIQMKGAEFNYTDPTTGQRTSKRSYEDCYGIKFFEISAVFDPADETALSREVIHEGAVKTAANEPQSTLLHAPEDIDTLRKETICEVCGSDVDGTTCEVCGWERPPDGFDNPDLSKAKEHNLQDQDPAAAQQASGDDFGDGFGPSPESEGTSNQPTLAHVKNDMDWETSLPSRVAFTNPDDETPVVPNNGPSSNQPLGETVLEDHTKPVTSSVRTAKDFLAAAGANENRRSMSDHKTADAASGAPAVATPDKNVDTDGVGGVLDASNEQASKADAQVDVGAQGGTGVENVSADSTTSVDQGDEKSKNIESIPTKTFDDGSSAVERQADPVGGEVFPPSDEGVKASSWEVTATDDAAYPSEDGGLGGGNAVEGVQPADPVGNPDERVDVLDHVTSPANNSGETKTWSGTDGNGVLRQQEPVTTETLEGSDIVNLKGSSTHVYAALKTADLEVDLGLISVDRRYDRAAELEQESPERLAAIHDAMKRVKTAGLSKAHKTARRMPSMARSANVEPKEAASEEVSVDPEFIFGG